ncbi:MAG TPA: ABC transporter ATP-binding protein [Candidatus Sabulitectum sp.]|nr:ABC transporter ATP-binding protein [Candidatus Sabulitectum sp.]HPJ28905.1 ABC transporter ATP-binding protein [Candidatus Sabulitectum sp.]HPR22556.1 ABC transporter ATP-binding protein [Candidatus Sabulitectum sp.]
MDPAVAREARCPSAARPRVPVVDADGITKVYAMGEIKVNALAGISLRIMPGEYATLMGASGSGKSTALSILGCLDRPTSGSYSLMGKPVEGMDDRELAGLRNKFLGFVFQTFNLLPRTSAVQNVELPLVYAGVKRADRREAAMAMLERVGLASRAFHRPNQLSGGERQRVAIARALVTDPALILADEPTGNLDSRTGQSILELFDELHDEGKTILMVTHDDGIARRGTRAIRISDGRIESDTSF